MHQVIIIGGGFGGLAAAQDFYGQPVSVTLVDRQNHHLFQPLLYQVATAGLAPGDIADPIRSILSGQKNVNVRLGTVVGLSLDERSVLLADGNALSYDSLIVAAGVTHSYFGNDAWAAHAPGLKTIGDALEIRRKILIAFEEAEWCEDPERRTQLMTFVVVGGGPTGVELAGALREIAFKTMRHDFKRIQAETARVILVEGSDGVLGSYPDALRASARLQLEALGVEVRTNTFVTGVDAEGVQIGEERIAAATVLWAAGVQASPLARALGAPVDRAGRVCVNPDLSIPGHPEVMVVGDLAHIEQDGEMVPGIAPAAQSMGAHAAANIIADLAGQARRPYRYTDKGAMATIGTKKAVLSLLDGKIRLSGFIAWVAWVFVHLMVIVGHRNRLIVFIKWSWAWLTYASTSRLIWQGEKSASGGKVQGSTEES